MDSQVSAKHSIDGQSGAVSPCAKPSQRQQSFKSTHSASVEHSGGGEATVPPAPLPPEPPNPPFPLDDEVDQEDEEEEDEDVPEDVVMTSEPQPTKTAKPKKDKPA